MAFFISLLKFFLSGSLFLNSFLNLGEIEISPGEPASPSTPISSKSNFSNFYIRTEHLVLALLKKPKMIKVRGKSQKISFCFS